MWRQQEQGRERPFGYRSRFVGTDLQAVKVLHGQIHMGRLGSLPGRKYRLFQVYLLTGHPLCPSLCICSWGSTLGSGKGVAGEVAHKSRERKKERSCRALGDRKKLCSAKHGNAQRFWAESDIIRLANTVEGQGSLEG